MSSSPAVIVKKGGFFASLAKGLFLFLTVTVLSATSLGIYAVHVVNHNLNRVFAVGDSITEQLPHWRYVLPPAIAEVLNDRRAVDYRESLEIVAKRVDRETNFAGEREVLITVTNNGEEVVSVLALNVMLEDEHGVPVSIRHTYAATPFAMDEDQWQCDNWNGDSPWRGTIFPGDTRKFTVTLNGEGLALAPRIEIAELRVSQPLPEAMPAELARATAQQLAAPAQTEE